MSEERRHPDIFTAQQAADYLQCELSTLDTYKRRDWLTGYQHGKGVVYSRRDLDECWLRVIGEPVPMRAPKPLPLGTMRAAR